MANCKHGVSRLKKCEDCEAGNPEKNPIPSDAATCSRIRITLEITDPEVVSDYKNTCNELVWEDLVNGDLINFAEFVSRENDNNPAAGSTLKENE